MKGSFGGDGGSLLFVLFLMVVYRNKIERAASKIESKGPAGAESKSSSTGAISIELFCISEMARFVILRN